MIFSSWFIQVESYCGSPVAGKTDSTITIDTKKQSSSTPISNTTISADDQTKSNSPSHLLTSQHSDTVENPTESSSIQREQITTPQSHIASPSARKLAAVKRTPKA